MRFQQLLSLVFLLGVGVQAIDTKVWINRTQRKHKVKNGASTGHRQVRRRDTATSRFKTNLTAPYAVDGDTFPELGFKIGESYSGLIPNDENGELFFWFFPTTAPDEPKEILLWLNGGPGCSSLFGLTKENGPFLWPDGNIKPVLNPWSWHHLTNVVWVEQPVGTGFSRGNITATDEHDVARQFLGFWKNFIELFQMQGYKVYITGESYAGMYCPYIASAMLDTKDKTYYDVKGMHIIDPIVTSDIVSNQIPTKEFFNFWRGVFPLNSITTSQIINSSKSCGFDDFYEKYLAFPPPGQQPVPENLQAYDQSGSEPRYKEECLIWEIVTAEATHINPIFDAYQVTHLPPSTYDVLGGLYGDSEGGSGPYFNRTAVKKALHAPLDTVWQVCTDALVFNDGNDQSLYPIVKALPHVIEATNNVIISHAQNDFVLIDAGSLLGIQNMTWNGQLGFQCLPQEPLYVPYYDGDADPEVTYAGSGVLGTAHTERGLTWAHVGVAGHEIPKYVPGLAYRQTEFLLGRVDSLSSTKPFTNHPSEDQLQPSELGLGTTRRLGKQTGTCSKAKREILKNGWERK